MRRIELTWDDGAWSEGIAARIVEEIKYALDNPTLVKYSWEQPDSIKVMREGDPDYPDGEVRTPEYGRIEA